MNQGPYEDVSTNLIYQLLFCDRLSLFKANHGGELTGPWKTIFDDPPDPEALAAIANDGNQESRVRMLAYNLLREGNGIVPKGELLGTIVEVHLTDGLDTLAVFADGGVRYINHSGKIAIVEGTPNPFQAEAEAVISASRTIVDAIGPWDKQRLPSPPTGNIRMTFLVSDGLYFGEGPFEVMQQESVAAPLISAATALLLKVVDRSVDSSGH